MRSASSRAYRCVVAGAAIVCAGSLAGCVTTQETAARLRLNSARILASQNSTRVTVAGHTVAVTGIALVAAPHQTGFVVTVRNPGARSISDLPISVGYRVRGRRDVYLNAGSVSAYFDSHLPAVAAHSSLTWVYAAPQRLPRGARPFAHVGSVPAVPGAAMTVAPAIQAGVRTAGGGNVVTVAVHNLSGVPQLQLPVYAVAERDGRTVAAGELTLSQLAGDATQTLQLRLLGRVGSSPVRVQAPPTIFH